MKNLYAALKSSVLLLLVLSANTLFAQYDNGILVLNEGGAGSQNASMSYINSSGILQNNVYAAANTASPTLGDTAQSLTFNGNFAYVILNISNELKVLDRTSLQLVATISTGLDNPRYMAVAGNKAYITCWGSGTSTLDDYIAVLDLSTNTLLNPIPASEGVERIININNKLYIANQGGYGYGTTVSVLDPQTATITQNITVGDVPNSMVVKDGFLYVLCSGRPSYSGLETSGSLVKINLTDNTVVNTLSFTSAEHPVHLCAGENETIYFAVDEKIFESTLSATTLPEQPIITLAAQGVYGVYGMDYIQGNLYIADAGNYVTPGSAYVYSAAGTLLQSYTVGVIPNSFYPATPNLGIPENTKNQFALYPNPASNVFFINNALSAKVDLYDMAGRLVKTQQYSAGGVDVSDLSKGIYAVQITSDRTMQVQRLIVK